MYYVPATVLRVLHVLIQLILTVTPLWSVLLLLCPLYSWKHYL